MPAAAEVASEPFVLVADGSPELRSLISSALELLGGHIDNVAPPKGILADMATVARMSGPELESLGRDDDRTPIFLFATDPTTAADGPAALRALGGPQLGELREATATEYVIAPVPELWPFGGHSLIEVEAPTSLVVPSHGDVESLISSEAGCVYLRWSSGPREVYLSVAPVPVSARLLKDEFCSRRFMGLLPLLSFGRAALGPQGWRTPRRFASFMVDDANLRLPHYGFLDYNRVIVDADRADFHLALAMIPLDYAKTRRRAATLLRDHADRISIVPHGVDHRRCEFGTDVTLDEAERAIEQALVRMEAHRSRSGIDYACTMTFPHGICNETWLCAMRNVGLDAALSKDALPFLERAEVEDPLYELLPADMQFLGFPVIPRFQIERPKEELLFMAWLGRPLIVYTHHDYFRSGNGPLCELADFINRRIAPRWADVATIIGSNYQVRQVGSDNVVRLFSNRVVLREPAAVAVRPARGTPAEERGQINGRAVEAEIDETGMVIRSDSLREVPTMIELGPRRNGVTERRIRISPRSRLRRFATEGRDRAVAVLFRH